MRVIDHLQKAKEPLISFELIPPKRGGDITDVLNVIDNIIKFKPPFIDITSHSAEVIYEETPDGIKKKVKRKRPGTLGICALIQNKYNVDAVPHILVKGFTREETEDFMIELNYLGIDNVLAVRGDDSGYEKPIPIGRSANSNALELVEQIVKMNKGIYLEDSLLDARPTNFCVGVGGYPEKHFEAPSMKFDLKYLKEKIDKGAEYIVTQMFFDNQKYFDYVNKVRDAGIDVPIIPGIKPITTLGQITMLPRTFFLDFPDDLMDELEKCKTNADVKTVGIEWAIQQSKELVAAGVPSLHFYTMSKAEATYKIAKEVF